MEHIVYCDAKAKELGRLISGEKTMVIRGAAGRKLPHGRVFMGDTLYFIQNNGEGLLKAKGTVKSAFHSEKLTPEESAALVDGNSDKLRLTDAQVKRWAGKKYLCLIEVSGVQAIEPIPFTLLNNMDDWLAVEDIRTVTAP